jgi:hypothetical protein
MPPTPEAAKTANTTRGHTMDFGADIKAPVEGGIKETMAQEAGGIEAAMAAAANETGVMQWG